jgi:hypothetical protein
MGETCSIYGRTEKCLQYFRRKSFREGNTLEEFAYLWDNIEMYVKGINYMGVD